MELPNYREHEQIPIYYLKRFWKKQLLKKEGVADPSWKEEQYLDRPLLDALGIGIGPTYQYLLLESPSFPAFENWIKEHGHLEGRALLQEQFNAFFEGQQKPETKKPNIFSVEELAFFEEHGFVILKQAISKEDCRKSVKHITELLEVDLEDPSTWYGDHPLKHGIMVEYFKHPLLEQNRLNPRIRQAYEQLWQSDELWPTTDRIGFNPPETDTWKFPGPDLHLDIQPTTPLPFDLQGILYLTDTEANQGALTVIPGFHKKIDEWIRQFERQNVPLIDVFDQFEKKPIAAQAGDMVIWHHGLPHGSSPNTHTKPRIVQYITWYRMMDTSKS